MGDNERRLENVGRRHANAIGHCEQKIRALRTERIRTAAGALVVAVGEQRVSVAAAAAHALRAIERGVVEEGELCTRARAQTDNKQNEMVTMLIRQK